MFRSAQAIIRLLLQNFQNKAEGIVTIMHNMDPVCVSVFIIMKNSIQLYKNYRRLLVLEPVAVKCVFRMYVDNIKNVKYQYKLLK
jgi:hypothetical protein